MKKIIITTKRKIDEETKDRLKEEILRGIGGDGLSVLFIAGVDSVNDCG